MLTDTHAHLGFPDFAGDFDAMLERADAAGVKRIVTIGTSIDGSRRAVDLAERYPNVWAAIGVHPASAEDAPEDVSKPLRELAQSSRVVAIGETGLDYYRLPSALEAQSSPPLAPALLNETPNEIGGAIRDGAYKAAQARVFEQQLDLAVDLGLNVVIHERAAWDDTVAMLRPYSGKLRAVFHCFGGSLEHAVQVLREGHLVSFTGIVTFKNAQIMQETAATIPDGTFMVETDCPFLAPVPYRGKRCEPAHTRITAEKIASLRNVTLPTIGTQTEATAEAFFRFHCTSA
jgi:TatD DNase family protein